MSNDVRKLAREVVAWERDYAKSIEDINNAFNGRLERVETMEEKDWAAAAEETRKQRDEDRLRQIKHSERGLSNDDLRTDLAIIASVRNGKYAGELRREFASLQKHRAWLHSSEYKLDRYVEAGLRAGKDSAEAVTNACDAVNMARLITVDESGDYGIYFDSPPFV